MSRCLGISAAEASAAVAASDKHLPTALRRELLRIPLNTDHLHGLVLEYCAERGMSAGALASRHSTPATSRKASAVGGASASPAAAPSPPALPQPGDGADVGACEGRLLGEDAEAAELMQTDGALQPQHDRRSAAARRSGMACEPF
jgi:hypothetical protein